MKLGGEKKEKRMIVQVEDITICTESYGGKG
jgi:hypothetical protein